MSVSLGVGGWEFEGGFEEESERVMRNRVTGGERRVKSSKEQLRLMVFANFSSEIKPIYSW